jgi:predicted N-acetyltransferase YhbS
MKDINIRAYRPDDLAGIKQLTVEAFAGVTLEQNVETAMGVLHGRDWRWRKAHHIDEDVAANPTGVFVAEARGRIAGYISTRVDHESSKGWIPTSRSQRRS